MAFPFVRASSITDADSPGICRAAVFGFGPSALPKTTTGIPALSASRAQFMSGGPATALSANASYFPAAIASLQFAISFCTELLESNTVKVVAPSFLPTALNWLMIACSTGLDWMATKSAIETGFFVACGAAPAPPPSAAAATTASRRTAPTASGLLPDERPGLSVNATPSSQWTRGIRHVASTTGRACKRARDPHRPVRYSKHACGCRDYPAATLYCQDAVPVDDNPPRS